MTNRAEIVKDFISHGKHIIKLAKGSKEPVAGTRWRTRHYTEQELLEHVAKGGNLGWALGPDDLVIDVDPRNGGQVSWERLCDDIDIGDTYPTVTTPRDGFHVYKSIKDHRTLGGKLRKQLKAYPGIDFLSAGSFVVIPGSVLAGVGEWAWSVWFDKLFTVYATDELLTLLVKTTNTGTNAKLDRQDQSSNDESDLGDFAGLIDSTAGGGGRSGHVMSRADVQALLAKLDHNMPNADWVKVGMALKRWDAIDGLELWEAWSQGGDTYKEGETAKRWRSFDESGGDGGAGSACSVSMGTLVEMARTVDYEQQRARIDALMQEIQTADEPQLRARGPVLKRCGALLGELADSGDAKVGREMLAKALQVRLSELTGVRLGIADAREMIPVKAGGDKGVGRAVGGVDVFDGESRAVTIDAEDRPGWCDQWVYVNDFGALYNVQERIVVKEAAFNMMHGKDVPTGERGGKPSAFKWVSDHGLIEVVNGAAYLPFVDDVICDIKIGDQVRRTVNLYNHASRPKAAPVSEASGEGLSADGVAACELIKKHIIDVICNGDAVVGQWLLEWVAHQVQRPGRKLLWSPLIQSIQGVGKSFIGELLRGCLGVENVGVVGVSQVNSNFNGWASGVCVNVLEELRVAGMNRHGAANALKSLISDTYIQINEKGVKPYKTLNTCNYICFTNFVDAVPLEANDRRWFVVFCDVQSLDEIGPKMGFSDTSAYFDALWSGMRQGIASGEVQRWLLDLELSTGFLGRQTAPDTDYKRSAFNTDRSTSAGCEWLEEIEELIEKCTKEGTPYITKEAICSASLFDLVVMEFPDFDLKSSQRNRVLKNLGYRLYPKVLKIEGKTRRIWTRRNLEINEIKDLLIRI